MKKILLILLSVCFFAGQALALDKGQFKISTGLAVNDFAWSFGSDWEMGDNKETDRLYRIPLNVEYGIIKGLDVRLKTNYVMFKDEGSPVRNGFGQPALGVKYMFWIFGASCDVWLPLAEEEIAEGSSDSTKLDLGLYAEPKLGIFGADFLVNFFIDTKDQTYAANVITFLAKPYIEIPVIKLQFALGLQMDILTYPNTSSEDNGILLSVIPALKYKLGSFLELTLDVPIAFAGKSYPYIPGEILHSASPYGIGGYGAKIGIAFIF